MRTELGITHLAVQPGTPARIEIEVTNVSDIIDGVTAIVDGIDQTWIRFDTPVLSLFPSVTSTIGFTIDLPADCPAGDYLIVVRIVSTIDAERQTVHDFWINVAPVVGFALELRPRVITAGSTASLEATITNEGNVDAPVYVSALDRSREADCVVLPGEVVVPERGSATVGIEMRGPRPWFGQPPVRTIVVTAVCDDVEVEELATFTQKPRIPRGVITFLVLAGIIALWATIFLLVVNALSSGDDPAKATARAFDEGGAANVSLAAIAGTAEGRVTAGTTGEGVPRVTVEASRVTSAGELVPSGSAATADDGTYSLGSLIPGNYVLAFTGEGFDERWYPAGSSPADAGMVVVEPTATTSGLDVVISGGDGAFVGVVTVPESAQADPDVVVTATLIPTSDAAAETGSEPGTESGAVGPEPFEATHRPVDGNIRLENLPAPATYRIRVEGADFDAQIFEETLEAGEVKVLNTVRLGAAAGSIEGRVVDPDGTGLGNVVVTVANGDDVREVTTPTSGNVGEFLIVGLETPNTYVLTFSLDGYSGQTISLDLLAGEDRTGITALLIGGIGTVSGTVRDTAGQPIGDVAVTIAGNDFTAVTTTLTTGGDGAGVGSYSVSDIPVPGVYTVTFDREGYVPETIEVGFLRAGPVSGTDVVLRSSVAVITGSITGDGSPLGDVRVELSDGLTIRSTVTATSPPGIYRFDDVMPGTYTLRVEAAGFVDRVELVRVGEGAEIDRPIVLTAS